MTEIPNLSADIFFGGAEDHSLPDWRKSDPDVDDPEKADAEDNNTEILRRLYGYDPGMWDTLDADDTEQFSIADPPGNRGQNKNRIIDTTLAASNGFGSVIHKRLDLLLKKNYR
jgi:hypothetical protein